MVVKQGVPQKAVDDFGGGQRDEFTERERGHYGQALHEGQVHRPTPGAPRIVNTLLWVFNVIGWLLLAAFMAWRVYVVYLVENV